MKTLTVLETQRIKVKKLNFQGVDFLSPLYQETFGFMTWHPARRAPDPRLFLEVFPALLWALVAASVAAGWATVAAAGRGWATAGEAGMWVAKKLVAQGDNAAERVKE